MSDDGRPSSIEMQLHELDLEIRGGRGRTGIYGRLGEIEGRSESTEIRLEGIEGGLRELSASLVAYKCSRLSPWAVALLCFCAFMTSLAWTAIAAVTVLDRLQSGAYSAIGSDPPVAIRTRPVQPPAVDR